MSGIQQHNPAPAVPALVAPCPIHRSLTAMSGIQQHNPAPSVPALVARCPIHRSLIAMSRIEPPQTPAPSVLVFVPRPRSLPYLVTAPHAKKPTHPRMNQAGYTYFPTAPIPQHSPPLACRATSQLVILILNELRGKNPRISPLLLSGSNRTRTLLLPVHLGKFLDAVEEPEAQFIPGTHSWRVSQV
jgi:hypothetical protein